MILPKYKFTVEYRYPDQAPMDVTVETQAECVDDVVESFKAFLIAAGFSPELVAKKFGDE